MLSRDAKIFEKESAVRARMVEYGTLFEELHIVVLNKRFKNKDLRLKNIKIGNNVWVYPTNSRTICFYAFDAMRVAKKIFATNYKPSFDKLKISSKVEGQTTNWVITAQDPFETGYVASKIAKKLHIPLQIQIHTDFLSPYFWRESLKNKVRVFLGMWLLKKADCIRVVSNRIKDSIKSNVKCQMSDVSILPIFVDAGKIKNAAPAVLPKKFDFTILWVGRLEKEKNCSLALAAFTQVVKKIPNAGLIIVGDGSEREKLELRIRNYELSNNVIIEGWKNDSAGYYKSADVLLVTSLYEGYGLSMVEARIAGIPVIAPDVGIAREVGAHITDHTADSIAETLVQLHSGKLPKRDNYEYPYTDKKSYLELYKKSFERCLQK